MKMVPVPPPTTSSPMMSSSHQQFEVTEDTPVDFLEGCMEILVVFPNEKSIPMSIQRRMPMLDLLIHVTAANKISPAAHLLQVTDEEGRLLPHKPSTPIGSLNAHKVYIVSKNRLLADRSGRSANTKSSSTASSPFEQSFRVQVRLPRNQLFVTRVTGRTQLDDLLHTVCNEKALDPRHYELRHPVNLDERLRLSSCLDDYKLQEVVLVPLGGRNSQSGAVLSVHDLTTMNKKAAAVTVSNSSSSKMSGKSTLRPTSSEATLAGHEKKKRGLFGLLGFGKSKKGSSMGDSSISSDSAGDRSISPSRSEEPSPPAEPQQPVAPSPPSPVLFSKRLAEEAVAKRNSRLMMSQMSTEPTNATTASPTSGAVPTTPTLTTAAAAPTPIRKISNGVAPTKLAAKKKRAPAPPPPPTFSSPQSASSTDEMNGPPKAASEVSSYSTSSSGSNAVSPSTSVIHHSETEMVVRSPSPKLSYHRQGSNSSRRQPDSGSCSPMRPVSNLLTTPDVSSSNLTQVSSTSNASLASAIKKRKAPVPPPALHEQVEASTEKARPLTTVATTTTTVVISNDMHDDSDRASSVSDQMSSVSDLSSPRKSATPEVEPVIIERPPTKNHQTSVVAPIPAARTRFPLVNSTPPPRRQSEPVDDDGPRDRSGSLSDDENHFVRRTSSSSSLFCEDELTLDGQSLDMFASRHELDQAAKATAAQILVAKQLELQAHQQAETERLKLAKEQLRQAKEVERHKMEEMLAREKEQLQMMEQQRIAVSTEPSTSYPQPMKRKKWDRPADIQLEMLATRSNSTTDSDDEIATETLRRLRAPSRASSVSEFFSLSEGDDEDLSPIQQAVSSQIRQEDENSSDPDAVFASMHAALVRRKERGEPELPDQLDGTIQSMENEVDRSHSSAGRLYRRSSSEPGWISEKSHQVSPPTSPARRSGSFDDGIRSKSPDFSAEPPIFPLLSNSFFSAVLSSRGEYEDIPLLLVDHDADGRSPRQPHQGLDPNGERRADTSSEDDYEELNYKKETETRDKSEEDAYSQAEQKEELVVSEPIYTMVIKSPKLMKAIDRQSSKDHIIASNGHQVSEFDEAIPGETSNETVEKAISNTEEEEPEMERDAGDGQTESPVMWEYKLPAPPTPFQDSGDSPLDKLQITTESSLSRHSSMSTDSLQRGSADEEEPKKDSSPRSSSIDHQEEPINEIFIKEDTDNETTPLRLHRGAELLGETTTEEQPNSASNVVPIVKEVVAEKVATEEVVVLQSSDPEAQQYGIESTTDEPLSLQSSSSLPPVPSTLPPNDSDDDSFQQPEMRFSIATYNLRVSNDSSYEKKLRANSPDGLPTNLTASSPIELERDVTITELVSLPTVPAAVVPETKEPETAADAVQTEVSGNNNVVISSQQPSLPMINAEFIQQFQNALHSITDPKVRTLQEEFLRLQQQLLTLQMQAVVQQNSSPVPAATEPEPLPVDTVDSATHQPDRIKTEKEITVEEIPKSVSTDFRTELSIEADSEQSDIVRPPAQYESQQKTEESSVEPETPIFRYSGPPQVKLDTWKPGRPRSEVIDYSRSSSFNVPLAPVEKTRGTPKVVPEILAMDVSPVVPSIPEEVNVTAPVQTSPVAEEDSKIKPVVTEIEETFDIREKVEQIESNNSSTNTSPKPVVLRKSSFLTARPFEARPVSMPIKRPSFTPMIQPVPFVSRKIRAPEVRGFASLPPVNSSDQSPVRMVGPPGIAPFSSVNKPRTVNSVSKENPTIVIRNKLIESARRPSAELNGSPLKIDDSSNNQVNATEEAKESFTIGTESRRTSSSSRPLSMPVSSSLLLAAGAGGAVNKPQQVIPEIPDPPILSPTTLKSIVPGADSARRRSLSSKFVRKADPREELLNSIRSFANGGSLKKTGACLDK